MNTEMTSAPGNACVDETTPAAAACSRCSSPATPCFLPAPPRCRQSTAPRAVRARNGERITKVDFPPLANGLIGFLLDIPHALFLTFLSPFQTWHIGAMGLIGAAENLVMLALVPVAILWAKPWRQINIPLVLLCAGFCLALGLLVGWTTPVVGALLRYRVPLLPFWSLAVLAVIDIDKLPRWNLRRIR